MTAAFLPRETSGRFGFPMDFSPGGFPAGVVRTTPANSLVSNKTIDNGEESTGDFSGDAERGGADDR